MPPFPIPRTHVKGRVLQFSASWACNVRGTDHHSICATRPAASPCVVGMKEGSLGSESIAMLTGIGNRPPHSPFPRFPIPDCRFPSALQSTLTPLIPDPIDPPPILSVSPND